MSPIIWVGAVVGALSVLLVLAGNPGNMGVCVACFLRDIAGGLGLHRAGIVQYLRPEIAGFVLGSFGIAMYKKEFKVSGGSSPVIRFFLGIFVMIGALVFLGCPLRMVLRLAGGDLNALAGLAGFAVGIFIGVQFLKKGFSLGRSYTQAKVNGYILPTLALFMLVAVIARPAFIFFSESGPGSMTAPILLALAAGLIVGVLAQRTRLCMVGGIRDAILIKDYYLLSGFISIFVVALIGNLLFGKFALGFTGQPIAHNDGLWNFLGMVLAGWGSVLLGGCPLRQLILSGEGNLDSVITVLGLIVGGAVAHNFGLAASPAGVPAAGKVAVIVGFVVLTVVGLLSRSVPVAKAPATNRTVSA